MSRTPGPWRIHGQPTQARIVGPSGEAVAACRAKYNDTESYATRDANARLIAATPKVLKAALRLSRSLHAWERRDGTLPAAIDRAWSELTAAIEEAEGK